MYLHFAKMISLYHALLLAFYCMSITHAEYCGLTYNRNAYNQTMYDSQSYISSPNYPSKYPSSCTCEWTITAPRGFVVELTFTSFDTEGYFSSGSCTSYSDTLSIHDGSHVFGKLIGKYCSNILPPKVYSSGTSLYLKFRSDIFTQKRGFRIKYKAVVAKPDSTICSPFNTFSQNNNIKYTGSSGYIKSPLYGTKYPSSMQCTWVITAPKDHKIKLTFSDFKLEGKGIFCSNYYSSSEDQLEIKDGQYSFSNTLKRLCGTSFPSPVYSSGRYMWIRFRSNTDNDATTSTTGFKAKFEAQSTSSSSNVTGIVVGVVIAVVFVIFLVVICVCISNRKRTPGHVNVPAPAPATQTTVHSTQNPQQIQHGFVPPPVGYPPAPKGSHPPPPSGYPPPPPSGYPPPPPSGYPPPPPGSYPPSAAGAAPGKPPQSSFPMMQYPPQPIPNDSLPAYPGPPSYPRTNYQQVAPTSANQPYPPPQDTGHQQSPYPPGATQPTAPPPF